MLKGVLKLFWLDTFKILMFVKQFFHSFETKLSKFGFTARSTGSLHSRPNALSAN